MNHFLHGVARATFETFPLPEPILEIGSYQVEGQDEIADLRRYFAGKRYIGVDMRPGPGVDLVADVENLPQPAGTVGSVIAMSTFEHVPRFWRGFDEIHRVLQPGGVLLVSCPFHFHIHAYPSDYWRFTPEALDLLLEPYPTRILGWHGPNKRPANVWAVAFGGGHPPILPDQIARYRTLLARHAHEPVNRLKTWRHRLARLICGRGPVQPFLEQDRWEIECRTAALLHRRQAS